MPILDIRENFPVSVAIPTYNRASYLAETLDAVLAQTLPAAEVVVVDDGSCDNTSEILEAYAGRIVTRRIKNSGPTVARKIAAEMGTAPWIAFCDSDDVWDRDHLERLARLSRRYPEAEFLFSNFAEFDDGARYYDKFASLTPSWWEGFGDSDQDGFLLLGNDIFEKVLKENPIFLGTTVALTRRLYEYVGGPDPRMSRLMSEDAQLTRLCVANTIVACDIKITARIRKHAGNFSSDSLRNIVDRANILALTARDPRIPNKYYPAIDAAIIQTRLHAMQSAFYFREFGTFLEIQKLLNSADIPKGLQLRSLIARMPTPLRELVIRIYTYGKTV